MITGRYKKIWFKKPDDIEAVKRRQGAKNQNLTTLIYAEAVSYTHLTLPTN